MLEQAFNQKNEFVPTRIYSDVNRLAPPQPRGYIENLLQNLAYHPKLAKDAGGQEDPETWEFQIHSIDYPSYLLPENHTILDHPERSEEHTSELQSQR